MSRVHVQVEFGQSGQINVDGASRYHLEIVSKTFEKFIPGVIARDRPIHSLGTRKLPQHPLDFRLGPGIVDRDDRLEHVNVWHDLEVVGKHGFKYILRV